MLFKSLIITLYTFNFVCVIILLGLSFTQISSNVADDELYSKLCIGNYVPTKIVGYYNDKPLSTTECAWPNRNSAQRIIIGFVIIIDLILLVVSIFKKSKINYWVVTLCLFALGIGGFYTSIYDSIRVKTSRENCQRIVDQDIGSGIELECEYKNIYATLGVGFLMAIFTILSSVLSLRYTSKIINQGKTFFEANNNSQEHNVEGDVDYNKLKKQHEKEKQKQQKQQQKFEKQQQKDGDFFKEETINSDNINNTGAILSNSSYPSFAATNSI
ncbi:hypothetical protein ACTA71_009987 [Dictyostelium dimigraforme]